MAWTYLEHIFTKALGFGTVIRHIIPRLMICAFKDNIDLKEKLRASVERREKLLKEIQLVKMSPDFPQQDGLDLFSCFRCVPRCSMPSHHSQVSFHHVTRGKRWHWLDMSRFWKFRCLMIFDFWNFEPVVIILIYLYVCFSAFHSVGQDLGLISPPPGLQRTMAAMCPQLVHIDGHGMLIHCIRHYMHATFTRSLFPVWVFVRKPLVTTLQHEFLILYAICCGKSV